MGANSVTFFIVAFIFVAAFVWWQQQQRKTGESLLEESKDNDFVPMDMNESFIAAAQKSKSEIIDAITVYSVQDLNLIRSLLFSSGIESYVQNEHSSTIFQGIGINGLSSMTISLFKTDYEEATSIVEEYIVNKKKEDNNKRNVKNKARNIGEFIVSGSYVSSNQDIRYPEIKRIDI